jgi:protein-S-isoprenylcysteine O-methyltransferase Ste14
LQRAEESLQVGSSPKDQPLRTTSFVIQASRWAIRDRKTRRKTMLVLLGLALLFLFSGSTFLQSALNPRDHPVLFILFWVACAWFTLAALLLSVFDLLMLRIEARKTQRSLHEKLLRIETPDSPNGQDNE